MQHCPTHPPRDQSVLSRYEAGQLPAIKYRTYFAISFMVLTNGILGMSMRNLIGMWIIRYITYVQHIINWQIQTWQPRVPFRSFIT